MEDCSGDQHWTLNLMRQDKVSRGAVSEILETLAGLGAAWRERRYDDLTQFFAEDMIFMLPGFGGRLEGSAAVIASYQEFMDRVTLTDYRESAHAVDVWADTAVANFEWEMSWLAGGVPNHERGHDVFVVRRLTAGGRWQAVWRTMIFEPSGTEIPPFA